MSNILKIKQIENKSERLQAVNSINMKQLAGGEIYDLIELFSDPYWPIREAVSKKIISVGADVSSYLVNSISSPNEDIRFWSSQVLAAISDDKAINLLINSFSAYSESEVNLYSAKALIKIGGCSEKHLIEALSSKEHMIRLYSVYCLGELKSRAAIPYLQKLLKEDANFAVRRNAATALGNIGDIAALESLVEAISDQAWHVRIAATAALGCFKEIIDSDLVYSNDRENQTIREKIKNTLLSSLSDTEAKVRETGARILSDVSGDESLNEHLLNVLDQKSSDREIITAVRGLGKALSKEALPKIQKLLSSDCADEIKKEALIALGQIGDPSSAEQIIDIIKNGRNDLALYAVNALFGLPPDCFASKITEILDDNREEIKNAAITALGHSENIDVRPYLYPALEDDSYIIRRQALLALYNSIGDEILSEAINMAGDNEEMVACEAITILGKIKSVDALPAISKAIEKNTGRVGYIAFQALAAIGPEAEPVVLHYLDSNNRDICYFAMTACEKIGSNACVAKLIDIIKRFESEGEIVDKALNVLLQFDFDIDENFFLDILEKIKTSRKKVIELFGKSCKEKAALKLLSYLKDPDREVRFAAVSAVRKSGLASEEVITSLIESLRDKYWPVRKNSAETLSKMGNAAAEKLINILQADNPNPDVIYWSLRALSESGAKQALPVFKKYISSEVADIKKTIIKGLGKIMNNESNAILAELLYDKDREIRFHAVKALKDTKDETMVAHLIKKLSGDEYENVRSFAAIALGNFKSKESADALKNAFSDTSHWVVKYAKEALSKQLK